MGWKQKRKQAQKAKEVEEHELRFDAASRKAFITGFRHRKETRRKKAMIIPVWDEWNKWLPNPLIFHYPPKHVKKVLWPPRAPLELPESQANHGKRNNVYALLGYFKVTCFTKLKQLQHIQLQLRNSWDFQFFHFWGSLLPCHGVVHDWSDREAPTGENRCEPCSNCSIYGLTRRLVIWRALQVLSVGLHELFPWSAALFLYHSMGWLSH